MVFTKVGNKICSTEPVKDLTQVPPELLKLSPDKNVMCYINTGGKRKRKSKKKSKRKRKSMKIFF